MRIIKITGYTIAIFVLTTIDKTLDWLYLASSDCDGMCDHCNTDLKTKCENQKNENKD